MQWLDHAGEPYGFDGRLHAIVVGGQGKGGLGHAGVTEPPPQEVLVTRCGNRRNRGVRHSQSFGHGACGQDPLIVDPKHCIEGKSLVQGDELVCSLIRAVQPHHLGSVSHHRLKGRTAVRGDDQVQFESPRSGDEIGRLVGRAGYEEYDAAHGSYDGSGGVERGKRRRANHTKKRRCRT